MNTLNTLYLKTRCLLILMVLFFSACGPTIHYLGDNYQSTDELDIYYDEKDVEKDYKTTGKMTHGNFFDYEVDTIKEKMIKKAKSVGADGIIFMDVQNVIDAHAEDDILDNDRLSITAKVIKYQ